MCERNADAILILEDGRIFRGASFGAKADAEGEIVFTTTMTGYQEVATDPSFRGQIVCMTYPLIGNYGISPEDDQSRQPWISGMVVREYCPEPSYWRSDENFGDYLKRHGIPAIANVDTRALTRHIRKRGAMRGLLVAEVGDRDINELVDRARTAWSPADANVVLDVTISESRLVPGEGPHIVVIDCGVKEHIVESLEHRGARVTVVPFDTTFRDLVALEPDGVLTSPGPGDPENAELAVTTVQRLLEAEIPFFGVCLGHQLLGLAIGASTSKLKFGHRGGNHPVKNLQSGAVYITSQNHGYQVNAESVPVQQGWRVSEINLNDGSVEGLAHESLPVMSVQYHPEGSPGPHDSEFLFDEFLKLVSDRIRAREREEATV